MTMTLKFPAGQPQTLIYTIAHTSGDAAESITVGGTVLSVDVYDIDSSGTRDVNPTFSVSKSGATSTVTIYVNATITSGYAVVTYIPE